MAYHVLYGMVWYGVLWYEMVNENHWVNNINIDIDQWTTPMHHFQSVEICWAN